MKIGLYMYDRPLELDEDATNLFLEQYDKAKDEMKNLLGKFDEEETRVAMFYMMTLRCFIDDFLEFCTDEIPVDVMEKLLNTPDLFDEMYENEEEEDEFEIEVKFDEDEEE